MNGKLRRVVVRRLKNEGSRGFGPDNQIRLLKRGPLALVEIGLETRRQEGGVPLDALGNVGLDHRHLQFAVRYRVIELSDPVAAEHQRDEHKGRQRRETPNLYPARLSAADNAEYDD